MLYKHLLIGKGRKQPEAELSEETVDPTVPTHRSMHAVMGSDEQSRIQIPLQEYMKVEGWGGEIQDRKGQCPHQMDGPHSDDTASDKDSHLSLPILHVLQSPLKG